ncbi:alanine racemase [Curtobacterium sp. MCJR17_055]|uniref:alanine racemase n=1 Tax=unclassified Curtobacterium TaxID=257496 RepID=UPI000D80E15E|nr:MULTISPECIES: alanine racemase [unclassified Curtobacterium]PYY34559.1 alanine racemase [Curtobacterium sp. MCBD17_029]PYY57625.1 alanine racemase [Curtobacterium sp. MCPF17_015]PYY58283.1 alanine racemase [Curtobacterium sp. MCJR17_055]WIB36830.1 alanine racemase [Curtobacterium sp. MCJR17_043]
MTGRPVSELVVHKDAVRANTAFFAERTGGRLMAVLKADAFGHGPVARAVVGAGARSIGVTSMAEALAVRSEGVDVPVLSWLNPVDADFATAVLADVDLAVADAAVLHAVARAAHAVGRRARVHLYVDVGMARDGCPPADWPALCALAREAEGVGDVRVVGVMGHMSCADRPDDPQNVRERLVFASALRTARRRALSPAVAHLAATAATLTGVGDGYGVSRIGAGLFGIDPSGTTDVLRPALTLRTRVVATRAVRAGSGVGYGHEYAAPRDTTLALLPLGYGDGLPRAAGHRAEVLLAGRRRPVVGRFSMDMLVVDTGGEDVPPGAVATVFGPGEDGEPTVAEWAGWASTIPHEIVTNIGSRVARVQRTTRVGTTPEEQHA